MTPGNTRLQNKPIVTAVLGMDLVGYSQEFDEHQARLVTALNAIILDVLGRTETSGEILLPTGDGMIITMPGQSTANALELALGVQRSIKEKLLRINLRMGIHEGQGLILTDVNGQRNIAGNAINICQRVMDIGDADHILLSESAFLSLKNSEHYACRMFPVQSNPVEVKHGVRLNIYSYYDGEFGNPRTPLKVTGNIGIAFASLGRPADWRHFLDTGSKLKIIGNCLRLPASPDFRDAIEVAIRTRGTQVQILLLNTLSAVFEVRSTAQAYKSNAELETTFDYVYRSLVDFHSKIQDGGEPARKAFDVRLFDAIPTFAGFITDDKAYISLYLENTLGSMGPYLVCNRLPGGTSLYDAVEGAFDVIWEQRSFSIFEPGLAGKQQRLISDRRESLDKLNIPSYQLVADTTEA